MKNSENKNTKTVINKDNIKIVIEPEDEIFDDMEDIEELSKEIKEDKKKKETKKVKLTSHIATVCVTVAIVSIFMVFIGQFVMVSGSSMTPTYENGNIVFIEKISNKFERFDVVTVMPEGMGRIIIKRIIGVPGDTVQINDGSVYINNKKLDDVIDTKIEDAGIASSPLTLKENEYFILGDNRNGSYDSRFEDVGIISADDVFGKVFFKLF